MVHRFYYPRKQIGPQVGAKMLRLLGFGVMSIVRLHPNEAQIGDFTIELNNNFITNFMHGQVWMKIRNGTRSWESIVEL